MHFTDKDGSPWLVGKHPRDTADTEIDPPLDPLDKIAEDAAGLFPMTPR